MKALCLLAMGETAERAADLLQISREEQDQFAVRSQQRAVASRAAFQREIVPIQTREGDIATAEHPRADTTLVLVANAVAAKQRSPRSVWAAAWASGWRWNGTNGLAKQASRNVIARKPPRSSSTRMPPVPVAQAPLLVSLDASIGCAGINPVSGGTSVPACVPSGLNPDTFRSHWLA